MKANAFSEANWRRCHAANGFDHKAGDWSLEDWFVAFIGEVGEAANIAKKYNRIRDGIPGNKETPFELSKMMANEIADMYIYLDLIARREGYEFADNRVISTKYTDYGLSELFIRLSIELGRASEIAIRVKTKDRLARRDRLLLFDIIGRLFDWISMISYIFRIDLASAVVTKFNAKSIEIGYPEII